MAKRAARHKRQARPKFQLLRRWGVQVALMAIIFLVAQVAWLDLRVQTEFEGRRWAVPARVYARPLELYAGRRLTATQLEHELRLEGDRAAKDTSRPGTYSRLRADRYRIRTRDFRYVEGLEPATLVDVEFSQGRVSSLGNGAGAVALVRIDPAVIAKIYPAHKQDRVLVRLQEVPALLVNGLVAVEDRGFFEHSGVSLRGIARAAWANTRAGKSVQGGSTLTQQLAKNFFLSPERSIQRKASEALTALILEMRYEKTEILEAYLNEVFLGQSGSRAVHGFGLASEYYFGRPLPELELDEMALLIALVRGASYYNPHRHPQRARQRRDLVLSLMASHGVISDDAAKSAMRRPLGIAATAPGAGSDHPAFVDLLRRQLERDYHDDELRSEGLRVFTTLDPTLQRLAEESLTQNAQRLEHAAGLDKNVLQGAVVVTSPTTGEVLALVGDRNPRSHGFNRALDARRPVGSVIKPAVYLSALRQPSIYHLGSLVDDAPVGVKNGRGETWVPRNYDETSHGQIPLIEALSRSYNQATVRLGMNVGLDTVVETLTDLGLERDIPAYPSLLLGAVELTPYEVTRLYQTLATGGFQAPLRAIREVTGPYGEPLSRYGLRVRQSVEPGPVFLVNHAMVQTTRDGTGRSLYRRHPTLGDVAGKTGTTNDLRDSWFAGYNNDLLTVVWLGRDDNQPTGLSGATGALVVFGELLAAAGGAGWQAPVPETVSTVWFNRHDGLPLAGPCGDARPLPALLQGADLADMRHCGDQSQSRQNLAVSTTTAGDTAGKNR